ncbi:MAG TPA: TetR/AcrR family transcriptional regulator [Nocardioides sp.]|nr:TetR/AcrR family transcriptional regulator [Nocardioides sp.]
MAQHSVKTSVSSTTSSQQTSARERLLTTAAGLFYREGITGVGVDRLVAEAGVTRATMYRHFAGKEGLVVAYLDAEDATIRGYFAHAAQQLTPDSPPVTLLEAVIEGVAEDARRYHTRGCPFINAAAEYPDAGSPVREVVARHRDWFRATLAEVVAAAGVAEPDRVAASLVLLRDAALVGVYLDGEDTADAFRRAARHACGLG